MLDSRGEFIKAQGPEFTPILLLLNLLPIEHEFHPHCPSHRLVFSMCWLWLIPQPILLSSLPAQYSLTTTSGFSLADTNQAISIFYIYLSPHEDHHLPSVLRTRATGWMIAFSCLLNSRAFLMLSQGVAYLPSVLFYKSKMLSSDISGTALVEKEHWGRHKTLCKLPQ